MGRKKVCTEEVMKPVESPIFKGGQIGEITSAADREEDGQSALIVQAPVAPTMPVEGGRALFYDSNWEAQALQPEVATITLVWGAGCVNLDNGKSSVLVFDGNEANRPSGYYCVLLSDEEADLFESMANSEDPPTIAARANFTRLELVQQLPEIPADADLFPVEYEPGSIECFKGVDRRTMRVVAIGYPSGFAQQAVV